MRGGAALYPAEGAELGGYAEPREAGAAPSPPGSDLAAGRRDGKAVDPGWGGCVQPPGRRSLTPGAGP